MSGEDQVLYVLPPGLNVLDLVYDLGNCLYARLPSEILLSIERRDLFVPGMFYCSLGVERCVALN